MEPEVDDVDAKQQKLDVMKLIYAFATSTKHALRNEFELTYSDLYPYISHLAQ